MTDRILSLPEGTRLLLLAPVCARAQRHLAQRATRTGKSKAISVVRVNGTTHMIEEVPALDKKRKHDIEVVVDRIVVSPELAHAYPTR